jgi:hypothetical protein
VRRARDAVVGQRVLVAGLRRRQQPQGLEPLVADQRLGQFCHALDHVDEVEDDAALRSQHQVEVAQPHVEIDDRDVLPGLGEGGADRGGGRGLADTAFTRCDHEDLGHVRYLPHLSIQRCNRQDMIFEPALRRTATKAGVHFLGGPVVAVDRNQLGFVPAAENSRPRVSHGARHGPST